MEAVIESHRAAEAIRPAAADCRVLSLSMRRLERLVGYSTVYELEDVLQELTGADRVEPSDMGRLELSRRSYKLFRFSTGSPQLARALCVKPPTVPLERDYDLFFPTFNHTHELYALATVPDWRKRCRTAACFINEVWLHLLPHYLLELMAQFDHIFLGMNNPIEDVAKIVGRPCSNLPLAANVLLFAPQPEPPLRSIDVCNIGRRSEVTHAALLQRARQRDFFYYYDTVAASGVDQKQRTFQVQNAAEHRRLLASILIRSRYYFANRARVNEPNYTMGRDEISARPYEGCAAGTVMIGEPPRSPIFSRQFDWPDAVIEVPFESPDVVERLAQLDADPERLAGIRRQNVSNAARRHDWVHRIRTVFEALGLPPTQAMLDREERLRVIAAEALTAPARERPVPASS